MPTQSLIVPPLPHVVSTVESGSAVVCPEGSVNVRLFATTVALLDEKFQVDFSMPVEPVTSNCIGPLRLYPQLLDTAPAAPVAGLIESGVAVATVIVVTLPVTGSVNVPVPDTTRSAEVIEKLTTA